MDYLAEYDTMVIEGVSVGEALRFVGRNLITYVFMYIENNTHFNLLTISSTPKRVLNNQGLSFVALLLHWMYNTDLYVIYKK